MLAAENDDPAWSRASALKCIEKLVAHGDIDIKTENGAPAASVSFEQASDEFMAKEEKKDDAVMSNATPGDQERFVSDDDEAEQIEDPMAYIHNEPEDVNIYRQLKPFFSETEQKMLLAPHKRMTVHDYIESVREKWSLYVGDVVHVQLGEEDMFFLVLSAEKFNGETCLIVFELTANPDFDHLLLAITAVEIADMCRNETPEVNIYQEGSMYDMAYHPRGVNKRQAIKNEIVCRHIIKEARDKGWLLPYFTRASGEGPFGVYKRVKHSSLLTLTHPRDMHNPEFKLGVRQLELENAYRNVVRTQWLLPAKNDSEKFKWDGDKTKKWERAPEFQPRSEDNMMDDSEQANQEFWEFFV